MSRLAAESTADTAQVTEKATRAKVAQEARETFAEILWDAIDDGGIKGRLTREDCGWIAGLFSALVVEPR